MPLDESIKPNILLVDDDATVIQVISKCLVGLGRLRFATNGAAALRLAREEPPDLLLLDAEMPGMGGFEVWEAMRNEPALREVSVIFVTSHSEEAMEEKGLAMGASDFIAKPVRPAILVARVKTQLRLKLAVDSLKKLATTDSLTQCANRRILDERLAYECSRTMRAHRPMSVMMIDVDHFKKFNDHYGHPQGDLALAAVAQALRRSACRPGDLVARYGGEEFAVILPDTDHVGAQIVADAVHKEIEKIGIAHLATELGRLSVSVGVSSFDESSVGWQAADTCCPPEMARPAGLTAEIQLAAADRALYAAKRAGRSRSAYACVDLPVPQAVSDTPAE